MLQSPLSAARYNFKCLILVCLSVELNHLYQLTLIKLMILYKYAYTNTNIGTDINLPNLSKYHALFMDDSLLPK